MRQQRMKQVKSESIQFRRKSNIGFPRQAKRITEVVAIITIAKVAFLKQAQEVTAKYAEELEDKRKASSNHHTSAPYGAFLLASILASE